MLRNSPHEAAGLNGSRSMLYYKASRKASKVLLFTGFLFSIAVTGSVVLFHLGVIEESYIRLVITVSTMIFAAVSLACNAFSTNVNRELFLQKVQVVERAREDHPERPQLAWDLARIKLEDHLDRNLSQVQSIFWLTVIVMLCGFAVVMYGLIEAAQNPAKLPISIVAAGSGVLISFIGGSFLLIYRSILSQSKGYVSVLERINAVGMAIQVISNIPESNAELKHNATAELARQLLGLYANSARGASQDGPTEAEK